MKRLRVVQIGICHEHANDKIDTLVAVQRTVLRMSGIRPDTDGMRPLPFSKTHAENNNR